MPVRELDIDLDEERESEDISSRRKVLNKLLQGNWNTLLKGEGMEFAGFRQYTYEDDASRIDWKATLRSDKVLVREFEEHRNLNVYVLLDVSDTMLFTSQRKLKAEYGAELAFAMCDSVLKAGDAVGLGLFTDRLVVDIPPNIGRGAYYLIRAALLDRYNYGGHSNVKEALKYVSTALKERSLVVIISDFIGLQEGWKSYLDIIAARMDVLGVMLRDPRDRGFPSSGGQFELQDPDSGETALVDTRTFAKAYAEQVKKEERDIEAAFTKTNSGFVKLTTGKGMYEPLLSFFNNRKRMTVR